MEKISGERIPIELSFTKKNPDRLFQKFRIKLPGQTTYHTIFNIFYKKSTTYNLDFTSKKNERQGSNIVVSFGNSNGLWEKIL